MILTDTERKVLRIIYSRYREAWHKPDTLLLSRLSQRERGQVRFAIVELIVKGFLEAKEGKLRIIQAWEPHMYRQDCVRGTSAYGKL